MIQNYKMQEKDNGVHVSIGHKTMFFDGVSREQMVRGQIKYAEGSYVQNAFRFLDADQREFLMSGLLPEEFDNLYDEDEDDDNFEYTYFT